MSTESNAAFVRIADQSVTSAENVDCDSDEFHAGLVILWHKINERCENEGVDPRDPDLIARSDE